MKLWHGFVGWLGPGSDRVARHTLWALAGQMTLTLHAFLTGFAFRLLGEIGNLPEVLLVTGLYLAVHGFTLYLLARGLVRLVRGSRWGRPFLPLFGLIVVFVLMRGVGGMSPYEFGAICRLRQQDEKAYMTFAETVRRVFPDGRGAMLYALKQPPELADPEEKAAAQRFLDLLPGTPAEAWPQEMLMLTIYADYVCISRGSGMLGQIGVAIFDQAETPKHSSPEELAMNPYLPRFKHAHGRVYLVNHD